MIPPKYSDLGKAAKDLFDKGYNYGFAKVDLKTTTSNGVDLTTKGCSSLSSGNINGSLETKFKPCKEGLTITEKWSTDNKITTEVAIDNQLVQGSKVTLSTSFSPNSGAKSGSVKTSYQRDCLNATLDTDINITGPTLQGSTVVGCGDGWLAGYQFAFDTSNKALTKNNFAVGYTGSDMQVLLSAKDMAEFGASIYQKVQNGVQLGVQLSWTKGQNATSFGVASKYAIDSASSISAKVNNLGQIGCGYSQKLRDGIILTLSSQFEGTKMNEGGHKLGLGLEFSL